MLNVVDARQQLQALLELAEARGIEVRCEPLGGDGGALCKIKGRYTLFVDQSSDLLTQLSKTAEALSRLENWEEMFVRPDLRELMSRFRGGEEA